MGSFCKFTTFRSMRNTEAYVLVRVLSPFGGDNRDRTDDPLLAKQVLSQLSYTPVAIPLLKVRFPDLKN